MVGTDVADRVRRMSITPGVEIQAFKITCRRRRRRSWATHRRIRRAWLFIRRDLSPAVQTHRDSVRVLHARAAQHGWAGSGEVVSSLRRRGVLVASAFRAASHRELSRLAVLVPRALDPDPGHRFVAPLPCSIPFAPAKPCGEPPFELPESVCDSARKTFPGSCANVSAVDRQGNCRGQYDKDGCVARTSSLTSTISSSNCDADLDRAELWGFIRDLPSSVFVTGCFGSDECPAKPDVQAMHDLLHRGVATET